LLLFSNSDENTRKKNKEKNLQSPDIYTYQAFVVIVDISIYV
jgi:hypothetical protein